MTNESKCPVMGGSHARGSTANQHWWPNQLNLKMLHQNPSQADPMGEAFNYAEEFKSLDLDALAKDIEAVMTTSQEWWPADSGRQGPRVCRMAGPRRGPLGTMRGVGLSWAWASPPASASARSAQGPISRRWEGSSMGICPFSESRTRTSAFCCDA